MSGDRSDLGSVGITNFFNGSVDDAECVLKQVAFDFIVREITPSRICGISPVVDYERLIEGKNALKMIDSEDVDREYRTSIHKRLKYYPFVKAKTIDGRICLEETDVDVYSFVLQKVMFNTIDAGRWICRRLGVTENSFQFAGNKDKRAVTFQEVSIKCSFMRLYRLALELNDIPDSFRWEECIEDGYSKDDIDELNKKARITINEMSGGMNEDGVDGENLMNDVNGNECGEMKNREELRSSIKIFDIRRSSSKRLGDLVGNRFIILLRNFKNKELIMNLGNGFLNYFGQQRFGNRLMNHEIGYDILMRDYESAIDKMMRGSKCHELYEAKRYEEAMNDCDSTERYIIRSRMKGMKDKDVILGLRRELRMLYLHSYQSLQFNNSVNERVRCGMNVMEGDLVDVDGEVKVVDIPENFSIFDVVLRLERGENKMLKGGYRKMIERAHDVEVEECGSDSIIKFSLNSSCYATMALREVIGDSVINKARI